MKKGIILIDDDTLVHMTWNLKAKVAGVQLYTFFTAQSFLDSEKDYDRSCVVYIDGNLGNGKRGEVESKKIFDLGFKEIHLATGEEPDSINKPTWIGKIQGKTPPF